MGMIRDNETGRYIETDVRPVEADDVRGLEAGWTFDCRSKIESEKVFKLIDPLVPDAILGSLAMKRCEEYVEVTLMEAFMWRGKPKRFEGVAGSFLAFAGRISDGLGGEGFIAMRLINQYGGGPSHE